MNAYIRFKLGMTEDNPTIKPYDEKKWSETIDAGQRRLSSHSRLSTAFISAGCSS
jgi:hypothetical protein